MKKPITVRTNVNTSTAKAWEYWNKPEHIIHWAFASDDWEAPEAENDLRIGGAFKTVMSAKDKSNSFDFSGTYSNVKEYELIEYDMSDGRHVKIEFQETPSGTEIIQTFDPENENSEELQRSGWQAIIDNFKKYVESNN
ncbi:MAG: SRPBCC domain-containing protein [Patescibacteria group bacterium]